jgi:hypothetical protein
MKRSVVALGLLGLIYAVVLPGASAQTTLLQSDFSDDSLLKAATTYKQGLGNAIKGDDTILAWYVRDGVLTSSPPEATTGSDGTGANNELGDPPSVRYLLLFGDKAWTDVAIQAKVRSDGQNTGAFGLILRAASKTKPEDPDSWYELRYTTGLPPVLAGEEAGGIAAPSFEPQLRLLKVVNGKWALLAETDEAKAASLPGIHGAGDQNASGATFRITATGNVIQGFISRDGTTFEKILEATDSELKAGRVGLTHYDYNPQFDDLVVDCQ